MNRIILFQANVNGEFNTGKINHKVLIGADSDYSAADSYTYFNPSNNKTMVPVIFMEQVEVMEHYI